MNDWETLIEKLRQFNQERDWAQFHNAKDLALALSIEASELNELFLWKKADEAAKNAHKYQVDKAKGSAKKYNEL